MMKDVLFVLFGLFIGAPFGCIVTALCVSAKQADQRDSKL